MKAADIRSIENHPDVRSLDWIYVVILVGFFTVIPFGSQILYFGDWDFWVDWKDKLWWPIISPMASILLWGMIQSLSWKFLRLPLGATFVAVACVAAAWASRYGSFYALESYPLNFVWPATTIPIAMMLDLILFFSRSLLFTALFGGFLAGFLFYVTNWIMLMPFLQPIGIEDKTFTIADLMGYEFLRPQTPEYLRRIDQGTLQAFLGERIWITAFTAGVVCPIAYWVGQGIGWFFAIWPLGRNVKQL